MCLGVPGKLLEVYQQDNLPMGKVQFGGIAKDVCLAYTPEAQVGDYVIVHVGFAISLVDETEAQQTLSYLDELAEAARQEEEASALPDEHQRPGNDGRHGHSRTP